MTSGQRLPDEFRLVRDTTMYSDDFAETVLFTELYARRKTVKVASPAGTKSLKQERRRAVYRRQAGEERT